MMMQKGSLIAGRSSSSMRSAAPVQAQASSSLRPLVLSARPFAALPVVGRASRALVVVSRAAVEAPSAPAMATKQEKTTMPMNLVFVATEVAPWSKTGLPIELAKRGHHVITIAPRYDQYVDGWDTSVVVDVDGQPVRFFHAVKKGVHRVFVDHPWFLAKVWGKTGSKLYGPKSGSDYVDNHKRFALFNKAAIEAVKVLPFGPGEDCVFVANDWHSALLPVLIKDVYQPKGQFTKAKVALCIHNIAFQGRMWEATYADLGLPASAKDKFAFTDGNPKIYTELDPMEEDEVPLPKGGQFKKVNWLKAGIISADKVLTVSPNYATEIMSGADKGVELHQYLAKAGVEGIVNGMDTEEWDPAADKLLSVKYDKTNVHVGKTAAKEQLQAECGLPIDPSAPLFAFIGRLEEQKGVDILLEALPSFLASNKNAQVVVLGTGKATLEKKVAALDKTLKGQYKGVVKFSAPLAHLITAGADFFMVPSRFEPCGLIQLHAMQYGTVPLVSSTGGLVDTVKEGVTGFHMGALDPDHLLPADAEAVAATMSRAAQVFSTPLFKEMVVNCISQDLSWAKPARKWEGVLEELVSGRVSAKTATVKVPVENPIPGDKPPSPILAAMPKGPDGVTPIAAMPKAPGSARPLGLVSSSPSPSVAAAPSAVPSSRATSAAPSPAAAGAAPSFAPKAGGVTAAPAAAAPTAAPKAEENGSGPSAASATPAAAKPAAPASVPIKGANDKVKASA